MIRIVNVFVRLGLNYKPLDQQMIDKHKMTQDEIESYIERVGMICYDSNLGEALAIKMAVKEILDRRRDGN